MINLETCRKLETGGDTITDSQEDAGRLAVSTRLLAASEYRCRSGGAIRKTICNSYLRPILIVCC